MRIGRRQMLAGVAATGAVMLAGTAIGMPIASAVRAKEDPEPLQHFPDFAEGFYAHGTSVIYIDERHAGWAPRNVDAAALEFIDLATVDLMQVVTRLRRRHWVWAIEHAALLRLDHDRPLAHRLLRAAIEHDLDAADCAGPALRLYDLTAAVLAHAPSTELQVFVASVADRAASSAPLTGRVRKWCSPEWLARADQQLCAVNWRAATTSGNVFSTRLSPALLREIS
jgi:hypothetical protein